MSGLWHGANWTFVVWGGVHGIGQVIESAVIPKTKLKSTGIIKWLRILIVFVFCTFAWIFFVSNSIEDSFYVIAHLFTGIGMPVSYLHDGFAAICVDIQSLYSCAFTLIVLFIYDFVSLKRDCIGYISKQNITVRYIFYCFIIFLVLYFRASEQAEFVYFQF